MKSKRSSRRGGCGCALLERLSAQQRFWLKVVVALVVVGAAVGIGVGISRAVGAGVWKGGKIGEGS